MNRLVDQVNSQIRAAVERAGASVIFIDYDHYIGEFDGRYCEPGVNEGTAESGNRPGLMFYELNTKDPIGLSPLRRSQGSPAEGTFEGDLGEFGMMYLYIDSEAKFADPNVDGTPSSAAGLVSAAAASSNAGDLGKKAMGGRGLCATS